MSDLKRRVPLWIGAAALVLSACGAGDGGGDVASTGTEAGAGEASGSAQTNQDSANGNGGGATATLTIGDDVYTWAGDQMNTCSIGGMFPANADFGVPPSQGGQGPWVQFIDRGDGGINFSAVLDGEEYSGTGSGEADEIRSDGFTYTGSMGTGGRSVEVELEVSCR